MKKPPSPEHARLCRELADRLIGPLRERARELGYALGVHGSLARDIDLIAAPWSAEAVPARDLAEAIRAKAAEIAGYAFPLPHEDDEYFRSGCPGAKPLGRLVWSFHLGGGPYIDLSVLPRGERADVALFARLRARVDVLEDELGRRRAEIEELEKQTRGNHVRQSRF